MRIIHEYRWYDLRRDVDEKDVPIFKVGRYVKDHINYRAITFKFPLPIVKKKRNWHINTKLQIYKFREMVDQLLDDKIKPEWFKIIIRDLL